MKTFKQIMNEAKVGKGNQSVASKKVIDFLSKSLGIQFLDVTGQEYSNNSGTYFGYLYISDDGPALRVNWEGDAFHSINYWDDYAQEMKPTMEIFVKNLGPEDRSFVKILPEIAAEISGNMNVDDVNESINEAIEYKGQMVANNAELVRVMYDDGAGIDEIKQATGYPPGHIRKLIAKYTGEDPEMQDDAANNPKGSGNVKTTAGAAETLVPSKKTKKADAFLDDTEYADPDIVYKDLDDYLDLTMNGYLPALLITGQGGIGKSFNVNQALKKFNKQRNEDYMIVKGRASAAAMYATLWNNFDKIVIFDDCDSVFDDKDALNILKGALDSGEQREISWMTKAGGMYDTSNCIDNKEVLRALAFAYGAGDEEVDNCGSNTRALFELVNSLKASAKEVLVPNHFYFEGQVIFISNRTRAMIAKADRALPTRCTCVDIVLRASDVIKRIETCLPHIHIYKAVSKNNDADITDESIKKEVYNWIASDEFLKDPRRRGKEMNFRTFNQIYQYRHAGLERWKELSFRAG